MDSSKTMIMVELINTTALVQDFSVANSVITLKPLIFFIIGVVIYSIFIFKFYKFIAKRDIFELNLNQYNTATLGWLKKFVSLIFYFIEYILIFPLLTFFWFLVLTVLLSFLAKEQTLQGIVLISVSLVAAVRITAYYNEDLSHDLAKMLPFALLGIYLVDASYFIFSQSLDAIKQLPSLGNLLVYYLVFAIALEFTLRILHGIASLFKPRKQEAQQ